MNAAQHNSSEPTEPMIVEAAQWLTVLSDEPVSEADQSAFQLWCNRDARHLLAMQRMRELWGSLDNVPAAPARIALTRAFAPSRSRLASRSAVIALLGVLVCGWTSMERIPVWLADQRTGTGERRDIQLSDGSQVQLNGNSALDIRFDGQHRVVELLQGEMWVAVAKDARRPFSVLTDQGSATALGTRYLVKRDDDGSTVVTVLESAVKVQAADSAPVTLKAGQTTSLKNGNVQPVRAMGDADPAAWTRGVLTVHDQPLADVLQALAHQRRGVLRFDERGLQGLRVSGVFRLDDTDAALATLADNLPITVEHFTDLWVTVKRR